METVWMYWNSEETPLIKSIRLRAIKKLHNFNIIYLNDKNIHTYIKTFPDGFKDLIVQAKSDWIRLYLIMTYGGIWSDASIIFNDSSNKKLEKLWKKTNTYDFVGFNLNKNIESWMFMSKKNGKLVTMWYNEFTKAIKEGFLNYKLRILNEGTKTDGSDPLKKHDTYFMIYYCLNHILQHSQIPKILIISSADSMLKLTRKCKWNSDCIMKTIKTKRYVKKLPFIKLTQSERKTNVDISSYFN